MTTAALAVSFESIGNIVSIVAIVLNVLFVLLVAIGILLGIKRGLLHSLLRLSAVILAACLSLAGTFALRGIAANLFSRLTDMLMSSEATAEIASVINSSPTLTEFIEALPAALAGPFVFFVLFIFLNLITYIVYKILKHITALGKKLLPKKLFGKLQIGTVLGALVSGVASFLIACCFFIPFSGYFSLAGDVVAELKSVEELDEELIETVNEADDSVLMPLNNTFAFKTTNAILGAPVFDTLTTCRIAGDKVVIQKEIAYIAETYTTVKPLIDVEFDFARFEQPHADALRKFAADFNHSTLIPHIVAEIIPAAATAWTDNKAFFGIDNPLADTPETLRPLLNDVFTILETTTYETLQGDLVTVAELLASMAESGTFTLLGDNVNARDIVLSLSQPGLISSLIDTLYENDRMRILIADLANLGFDAIGDSLSIPETDEAVRADLTVALNEEIKKIETVEGYENKVTALTRGIDHVFTLYGVEADDDEISLYAECIVSVGPISGANATETVEEYFSIISSSLNRTVTAATNDGAAVYLSSSGFTNENLERAINNYLQDHADATSAITLADGVAGNTALNHAIVTQQDIILTSQELFNVPEEAFKKQSKALENVLIIIGASLNIAEDGSISFDFQSLDTEALSAALHELADTRWDESGNELHNFSGAITNLVKSALQSVGIDAVAASNLVNHMLQSKPAEGEEKSKDTLSTAFVVLDIMGKETTTNEDIKGAIDVLVKNLDSESATVIADCISTGLLDQFSNDLGAERIDSLVSVTHDMIENFGAHADELSEEQLEAEAAYMQTIFELSMSAGELKADNLFNTEENGEAALGKTAEEFLECVTHSIIISETFIDHADDLEIAINDKMSDSDKTALLNAMEADDTLTDELKASLMQAFSLGTIGE